MFSRKYLVTLLAVVCLATPGYSLNKSKPVFQPISSPVMQVLSVGQASFVAAVACTAASTDSVAYRMDGWVTGQELYKSYINPALQCSNPYPYTITAVNMPMYFGKATTLTVSVDIELADNTNPTCPIPGPLLGISSDYTVSPAAAGYYNLWIPLDSPVVVNGPFFAGFYLGSAIPSSVAPAVLLDADPQHCQSYNIWDTAVGFVDLTNFPPPFDSSYNFPGRVAMEVAGQNGGSGTQCCQVAPVTVTDFGNVSYPQTKDLQFQVTNCGTSTLYATASESCPAFTLPSGGGSFSVLAGQSHTVTVRFTPPADGNYSCTVNLGNISCNSITFTGTSGTVQPAPIASWVKPTSGAVLMGKASLWIRDTAGNGIIDYAKFEYSSGGAYTEIGRDYDGSTVLRDGVNASESGNGFGYDWDFSNLPEGNYTLRATLHDTQNRTSAVTVPVYLEPTPPIAEITTPPSGIDFCGPISIYMHCEDENITSIQAFRHTAQLNYSNGISTLAEHSLGDANANPNDGNNASNNEFGDYYSGPAAAALLAKFWSDRGFTNIMKNSGVAMTTAAAAESLAAACGTRAAKGTTDEKMMVGLGKYAAARGSEFDFDFMHDPDYWTLRTWVEEEQRGVMLGLSGDPASWVTVVGFKGWRLGNGNYTITVSDPITGTLKDCEFVSIPMLSQIYLNGSWHRIDIMISMAAKTWTVSRLLVGTDPSGANGWAIPLDSTGLTEGGLYFLRSVGTDANSYKGYSTVLTRYTCATTYGKGDFDGNGSVDLADLTILVDFIANHQNPPVGGGARADCNCDQAINIADAIYFINYLFGTAPLPCH
ncbi:MAG: dockerin type I domain-containing protein [Candidatus Zixiibacteriota bacterium]